MPIKLQLFVRCTGQKPHEDLLQVKGKTTTCTVLLLKAIAPGLSNHSPNRLLNALAPYTSPYA